MFRTIVVRLIHGGMVAGGSRVARPGDALLRCVGDGGGVAARMGGVKRDQPDVPKHGVIHTGFIAFVMTSRGYL